MKFTRLASAVIMYTASLPILAASYTISEMPTETQGQNQYSVSIDNAGVILTAVENKYNVPIDLSTIDFENAAIIAGLTDIEAAQNGVFNLSDYTFLVNRAITGSTNFSFFTQQLGRLQAYKTDGSANDINFINAFDTESEALDGYSHAMETTPRDSVGGTHVVGNSVGPFRTINFENAAGDNIIYVLSDYDRRAFVQVGQNVTPLMPTNLDLGGTSQVNSINENFVVAGSGSIAATTSLEAGITNCADPDIRGDQPEEACLRSVIIVTSGATTARRQGLWLQRAHLWTVDVEGTVIDTTVYPTLVTDEEELTSQGSSQALDINVNNVAVGVASVKVDEGTRLDTAAAIFQNGVVTQIIDDEDLLPNSAITINDNGYIVGLRSVVINRVSRNKMFVYNMNDDSITFPDDFFDSSSTIPRAVNNNNVVVGSADSEATASSGTSRKTAAFMYDIEADSFLDLNTLIACDSPFDLIEATDINDNNEIVASALTKKPTRDARGDIILDESGEQVLTDTVVTVRLNPTGQAASECSNEDLGIDERQGAASGFFMFSLLVVAAYFRRKVRR